MSRLLSGLLNVTQIRMAIIEIKRWIIWYALALGDAWALLTGSNTESKKEHANIC